MAVVSLYSTPAIYAAIRPVVFNAISSIVLAVDKLATWIQQTLGIIRPFANRAIDVASNYTIKSCHMLSGRGTKSKFNTNDMNTIRNWMITALKNGNNFKVNSKDSYSIVYNMGKIIGTEGQRCIKIVFTIAGKIITTYPHK
ncbi:MAG: hypothetical protein FWC41_11230 [Firmicutes bacterium]|nr:hypothetical protein [Bacillota bacterium]